MAEDKPKSIFSQQGSELFDFTGAFTLYSWSYNCYDYKLMVEILDITPDFTYAVEAVNEISKQIDPECKYVFDGTIPCLKYLVKNKYLDIDKLEANPYKYTDLIIPLLKKYLHPTIEEVFDDVLNGKIMKRFFLDYPNIFREKMLKTPEGQIFLEKLREITKNGEGLLKMFGANEKGEEEISMNRDRWSPQALRCKLFVLAIMTRSGKFFISRQSEKLIENLKSITESDIQNSNKEKFSSVNAAWMMVANKPWNKSESFSVQEQLAYDGIKINIEGTDLRDIYEGILEPMTVEAVKKYYPTFKKKDPIYLAVMNAIVIILYRANEFAEKRGVRTPNLGIEGFFSTYLNYIFDEDGKIQDWFKEFYKEELEKRVKFIQVLDKNDISVVEINGTRRIFYLPVFESFRFFPHPNLSYRLDELVDFFHNRKIDIVIKNDVLKNIVFNIQKIVALENRDKRDENEMVIKDNMMLLILSCFMPIMKSIVKKHKGREKKFLDFEDITSIVNTELIVMVLSYDQNKNSSFLGYISSALHRYVWTQIRPNKTDQNTGLVDEESVFENVPDSEQADILELLESKVALEKVREVLEDLPEKQREAIKKSMQSNEKLSDTERRAKNRGIKKIKEEFSQ